jgi:DNA-binding transcriptional regulator YbjK
VLVAYQYGIGKPEPIDGGTKPARRGRRMVGGRHFCYGDGSPSGPRKEIQNLATDNNVRQRILDAALDVVEAQGIMALTQPKVSKAAGLRQSHLTYYFPRKADLFAALLDASHDRTDKNGKPKQASEGPASIFEELAGVMFDRRRMQFFLGIALATSDEPELRAAVAAHADELVRRAADCFGRTEADPAVRAFIDMLRGIGFRMVLKPDDAEKEKIDMAALAASFGLFVAN